VDLFEKKNYWSDEEAEAIKQFIITNFTPQLADYLDYITVDNYRSWRGTRWRDGFGRCILSMDPIRDWGRKGNVNIQGFSIKIKHNYKTCLVRRITPKNPKRITSVMSDVMEKFKAYLRYERILAMKLEAIKEKLKEMGRAFQVSISDNKILDFGDYFSIHFKISNISAVLSETVDDRPKLTITIDNRDDIIKAAEWLVSTFGKAQVV